MKFKKIIACSIATLMSLSINLSNNVKVKAANNNNSFVKAEGTKFSVDGHPFYFTGANAYDLFTYGDGDSSNLSKSRIENNYMSKSQIDSLMAQMESDGVKVVRTWGFSNESWHGFETAKGVYNEAEFMEFDYIMQSAKKHGMKVIICLENYWDAYGGINKKLSWEGLSGSKTQFFTNTNCKANYKDYAKHFIDRINHYTGVAYKDDPTIFSWELMNEPRYEDTTSNENVTGKILRSWVDEMAGYIKSIDSNHMVDAGLEGHGSKYNFGGDEGNPYVYIQQSPYIDFCSAHPYPDENWANLTPSQTETLMTAWINDAHKVVKKPFVMGEFNSHNNKEAYWKAAFDTIDKMDAAGGMFWNYNYRRLDDFTIMHGDSILDYYKTMSDKMSAKNGSKVIDTEAPTAPDNLSCSAKTSDSVSLSWTASTDNVGVTEYDIYNGSTQVGSSTVPSYTVTELAPSTTYNFTVKAKDAAGNVSNSSKELSVTTEPGTSISKVVSPVFSVPSGKYNSTQTVSISSATPGATIYYTTDGSNPNTNSAIYSSPINVSKNEMVKAYAVNAGMKDSDITSASYTIVSEPQSPISIKYTISSDWKVGATINVTITNNGATPINGWQLSWDLPLGETINNFWSADYTTNGLTATFRNANWNKTIAANGGTQSFGFNVNYSGVLTSPTSFTLNGQTCTIQQ
ncbi:MULTISPECIES: cellulose binding domain-containing protein [Clostridium]|uniref:cellulose binding domain-containing protein n=1 Tax=Clostridium TaxID=1485 RepID=UPI000825DAD8|nr:MULTISPECIES: cellulose binding domain-containing protein [Clostridium]PJI10211.1 hypothetical protein CUB90_21070 [Clostridium sp. CT7]